MGFDYKVDFAFKFIYKAALNRILFEHEIDHVFAEKSCKSNIVEALKLRNGIINILNL